MADDPVRVDRFTWERLVLSSRLPRATRDVLMVLAVYMSADGGSARPGLDNLALAAGRGRSVVSAHLATAVAAGYLDQLTRGGKRHGGGGMASEYAATVPADVWNRAEAILGDRPWRNPGGQPDGQAESTSGLQDVDPQPQRPAGRMLTLSTSGRPHVQAGDQRPGDRMLTRGQHPVLGSQRPTGRTPPRTYAPRSSSVETPARPSPDVPRARDGNAPAPTPPTLDQLVDQVLVARPDWHGPDVRDALDVATDAGRLVGRPWTDTCRAVLEVVADPATRWPSRIAQAGPWWDRPVGQPDPVTAQLAGWPAFDELRNARGRALMRATWDAHAASRRAPPVDVRKAS